MNPLQALEDLVKQGLQPARRIIWLGVGFLPAKQNAIAIDPDHLPTDEQCEVVMGFDVLVLIKGFQTKYWTLRKLCGSLCQARPRRLQVHDLDYNKAAYLKLGGLL